MLIGWLIYSEKDAMNNQSFIDWFIDEAHKQAIDLTFVTRESLDYGIIHNEQIVLNQNNSVQIPDFAIVRTIDPLLSEFLEQKGVSVFNSAQVARIANDKALTHLHVEKLAIPMPDTCFIKHDMIPDHPPLHYPFVLKSVHSRGGEDVHMIHNHEDWHKRVHMGSENDVIIQDANVRLGRDVRVFVVGSEIVGAVLRQSDTDFRANFTLGGEATIYPLSKTEIEMINRIIHAFDFGMVGIDFLIGLNGELLFNEIEDIVGSRTLSATTDINILQKYITHIKTNLTEQQT